MIRSHKAIIGNRYFYVTNLLIPVAFVIIGTLYRIFEGYVDPDFFLMIQALLMVYEASTEYFGYGAIYRKNNFGMEYLKTSVEGIALVKKSMLTDSLLRIARTVFYTLLPGIFVPQSVDNMLLLVIYALVLANVSVWSVSFIRYVTMYGFLVLISAPLLAIGITIDKLCLMISGIQNPVAVIMTVLILAGVVFAIKFADIKIKASYRDLA